LPSREAGNLLFQGGSVSLQNVVIALRIARLVSSFPSGGIISGGLLPNIYYMSKEETRSGHETAIFTTGEATEVERLDGVRVYRVGKPRLSRFFLWSSLMRAIRKSNFQPDVIHSMNAMPLGWSYRPRDATRLGAKCVLSVHTPVIYQGGFEPSKRCAINAEYAFLLKGLAKKVDMNIAVSRFVKRELTSVGVQSDRIAIVPSGLRAELFHPQPLEQPGEVFNCLYVGRIARIKGLENLVEAACILKERGKTRFRFLLVGGSSSDEDYNRIRSLISRLGAEDSVVISPPVPHAEMPKIYADCDCFVLPSRREPLGKVVLEAMSSRRPVIAARAGGIPDLVWEGKNGLLFEKENPRSLASRIEQIQDDEKLRRKMSCRGPKFSARFDWRRISRSYVEAFEMALRR